MDRYIVFTILSIISLQSCSDEVAMCPNCAFDCLKTNDTNINTNDCFDNWTCNYTIRNEAKIETKNKATIVDGKKTVFEMINRTEGDLTIADDEYTKVLILEIDSELNSFSATDDELENLKLQYSIGCYCSETEFKKVITGCIQGELQESGEWRIQSKLLVDYSYGIEEVNLDALFSF